MWVDIELLFELQLTVAMTGAMAVVVAAVAMAMVVGIPTCPQPGVVATAMTGASWECVLPNQLPLLSCCVAEAPVALLCRGGYDRGYDRGYGGGYGGGYERCAMRQCCCALNCWTAITIHMLTAGHMCAGAGAAGITAIGEDMTPPRTQQGHSGNKWLQACAPRAAHGQWCC